MLVSWPPLHTELLEVFLEAPPVSFGKHSRNSRERLINVSDVVYITFAQ